MLQAAREGQAGGGLRAGIVGQGVWGLPLGALGESSHAPGVGAEASGLKGAWGSQACWGHGGGAPGAAAPTCLPLSGRFIVLGPPPPSPCALETKNPEVPALCHGRWVPGPSPGG